jgi:hypothetical protein
LTSVIAAHRSFDERIEPHAAFSERFLARNLVVNSVSSVHSRRAYGFALDDFFGWYRSGTRPPFSKAVVQQYRAHLEAQDFAPSTVNVRLAAIRKLAAEAVDNGLLAPELAGGIAKVKGAKQRGVRAGNWLEHTQARQLLRAPNGNSLKAQAIALSSASCSDVHCAGVNWLVLMSSTCSSARAGGFCRTSSARETAREPFRFHTGSSSWSTAG